MTLHLLIHGKEMIKLTIYSILGKLNVSQPQSKVLIVRALIAKRELDNRSAMLLASVDSFRMASIR
jgi:hypothetical protein